MTLSLTIDSKEVRASPGDTVLSVAQEHGIYIPTLCHHRWLAPAGACRLCLVEVEGVRGYPTACSFPVADGMVVRTDTEALRELQREVLSLILSEHPYTCLTCADRAGCDEFQGTIRKAAVTTGCQYCPTSGQCELQDLVTRLELRDVPYPISYRGMAVEKDDPFFDRDYNLCILCGRCVRVCQEVRHAGILAFVERGGKSIVGTAFGRSHLDVGCEFCGSCVDVCPTGTLSDKRGKWEGTADKVVESVCSYCSVGCAVELQIKNDKLIRSLGHDAGRANGGQLCFRGRFAMVEVVHNPERLKRPLVRRDGRLQEVSWDEALDAAAAGLKQHRGDSFAAIGSAAATNEECYALGKFARTVMGSNHVASAAGYPEQADDIALEATLAAIADVSIRKVRDAGLILAIGTNAIESHPILGLEIRHALSQQSRLITIDPRKTALADRSTLWLQPKLATDHLLVDAIRKAVVSPDDVDLDEATRATGVSAEAILEAARLMRELSPTQIIYGSGVTHHPTAMQSIRAIRALGEQLGGASIMGLPGAGNSVGAHDLGLHPALLPGYRPVADGSARAAVEELWKTKLNPTPGLGLDGIAAGIRDGQIRALYVAGEMPPFPALSELALLIVQDILPTECAEAATVVLPVASFAETDGTLTNLEGRVQRLKRAIAPPGVARPGWRILRDLANRVLGTDSWPYDSAADVMAEIGTVVPAYAEAPRCLFGGAQADDTATMDGVLRRFETAAPKSETDALASQPSEAREAITTDDFPLNLILERNLNSHRGASLTERVKGVAAYRPEEELQLNPADAKNLGVTDGCLVKVESAHGSVESIARVTGELPEGSVFTSINLLAGSSLFPARAPTSKAYAVRIEPISAGGEAGGE